MDLGGAHQPLFSEEHGMPEGTGDSQTNESRGEGRRWILLLLLLLLLLIVGLILVWLFFFRPEAAPPRPAVKPPTTNQEIRVRIEANKEQIDFIALSPNGTRCAVVAGGEVGLWDLEKGVQLTTLKEGSKIGAVAFTPDGETLATAGRQIVLWDVESYQKRGQGGPTPHGSCLSFSPDGKTLAWSGYDRQVRLFDTTTLEERPTLDGHSRQPVDFLAYSPQGDRLASVAYGGELKAWNVASGEPLWEVGDGGFRSVTFSSDGQTVAACGTGTGIKLYDAATGNERSTFAPDVYAFYWLAFSGDNSILASAGANQVICLWNFETGKQITELSGHRGLVKCFGFSADGKLLISGGADGEVILWDLNANTEAKKLLDIAG